MVYLSEKKNQSRAPPAPIDPPLLIPVQTESGRVPAGQFTVDLLGAAPQLQSCEATNENDITVRQTSPVAFLYKFEDVDSYNVSFNWTVCANEYNNNVITIMDSNQYVNPSPSHRRIPLLS